MSMFDLAQSQENKEGPRRASWESIEKYIEDTKEQSKGKPEVVVGAIKLYETGMYSVVVFYKSNPAAQKHRVCIREMKLDKTTKRWVHTPNVNLNSKHLPVMAKACLGVLVDIGDTAGVKEVLDFVASRGESGTSEQEEDS